MRRRKSLCALRIWLSMFKARSFYWCRKPRLKTEASLHLSVSLSFSYSQHPILKRAYRPSRFQLQFYHSQTSIHYYYYPTPIPWSQSYQSISPSHQDPLSIRSKLHSNLSPCAISKLSNTAAAAASSSLLWLAAHREMVLATAAEHQDTRGYSRLVSVDVQIAATTSTNVPAEDGLQGTRAPPQISISISTTLASTPKVLILHLLLPNLLRKYQCLPLPNHTCTIWVSAATILKALTPRSMIAQLMTSPWSLNKYSTCRDLQLQFEALIEFVFCFMYSISLFLDFYHSWILYYYLMYHQS